MSFDNLPLELQCMIYAHCDTNTLFNLRILNYDIPNYILHPRLQIVPYFDLEEYINDDIVIIVYARTWDIIRYSAGCEEIRFGL
jgi:hypothetical protein